MASSLSIASTGGTAWDFDLARGVLQGWKRAITSYNVLAEPLTFELYRALTDNDRGDGAAGWDWRNSQLHLVKHHPVKVTWEQAAEELGLAPGVVVTVTSRLAPPVLSWKVDMTTTYRFMNSYDKSTGEEQDKGIDHVLIKVHAKASGDGLPKTFARFGLKTALIPACSHVKYRGRGPGEGYRDKKQSQLYGTWTSTIDELHVPYEYPQDNGNRTDVTWVEFYGHEKGTGTGAALKMLRAQYAVGHPDDPWAAMDAEGYPSSFDGGSFQAGRYDVKDLDEATHPYELKEKKRDDVVVHLDWMHHGLGTGSCGPLTLPQHSLSTEKDFDFEIVLD